ncbi:MAG TPA: haloacid dehalogenase type II [Acidobacteriaceae bacterium]|nr:haloacid dehalogenase type II [Acidobacteriaceae bacterium]
MALTAKASAALSLRDVGIKAVAFDAFAIFDSSPVFRMLEELYPGRGTHISELWRGRQFEYTWLRNSMVAYEDFWRVTENALVYATKQARVELPTGVRASLMNAYTELQPWPEVPRVLADLRRRGLHLALLSNMTAPVMHGCVRASRLDAVFDFHLSTDQVQSFKPSAAAYRLGLEAFGMSVKQIAFVAFGSWDAAGASHFGYPTYWGNRAGVTAEELGAFADIASSDLAALPATIDTRWSNA